MILFNTLFRKLAAVIVGISLILAMLELLVLRAYHEHYHLEARQQVNAGLAQRLVSERRLPLSGDRSVVESALRSLTSVNPSIDVYLVAGDGTILAGSTPGDALMAATIDIDPLNAFVAGTARFPTLADDPRDPAHPKIFSAARIPGLENGSVFLYVLLRGEEQDAAAAGVKRSHAYREWALYLVAGTLLAAAAGLILIRILTAPLRRLVAAMNQLHAQLATPEGPECAPKSLPRSRDEVGDLSKIFAQMAERIRSQMTRLKETDVVRREILTHIAHDLRTPLASLRGYLETLSAKPHLPEPDRQRYIEIAAQEAGHLSYLVDRLFELARLESPDARIVREPFDLSELIGEALHKVGGTAAKRGVRLEATLSASEIDVVGDPRLIERVLVNLLQNGIRHTPSGGSVAVLASNEGSAICIEVADTGCGIAPEDLPRIFDKFYVGRRTPGESRDRSGLGLAIVKRILDLHGQSIEVESRVGQGSVFRFRLPKLAIAGQTDGSTHGIVKQARPEDPHPFPIEKANLDSS
jgi:signal transduction histidine kinase